MIIVESRRRKHLQAALFRIDNHRQVQRAKVPVKEVPDMVVQHVVNDDVIGIKGTLCVGLGMGCISRGGLLRKTGRKRHQKAT
ncbi:MAG: hypothetical protein ACK5DD_01575 [Cyclobacteriaceae bacterium]